MNIWIRENLTELSGIMMYMSGTRIINILMYSMIHHRAEVFFQGNRAKSATLGTSFVLGWFQLSDSPQISVCT